jgi:hypothetical protein
MNRCISRDNSVRAAIVVAVGWVAAGDRPADARMPTVVDPGQGVVSLPSGSTAAAELSGIAWTGGSGFLAVGDNGAKSLWTLGIGLDPATGFITSATVTGSISAAGLGSDSEGIAYRAATGSVFVSDEVASTITQFDAATGTALGGVAVPAIYAPANVQSNMGLESLAFGLGGLWTANEEAVVPDGPLSSTSQGSWVRIQRFDESLAAAGQWAYRTDPISALNPFVSAERSGVVDILPWTATSLLVLERELGGAVVPTFRSRLYGVDVTTASDVSAVPSLVSGGFTPLAKTLLWEGVFGASNFEGMTFGPALVDGSTSLLLISDNGGGLSQDLYALSVVPEPGTVVLMLVAAGLGHPFVRRRAHRRKAYSPGRSSRPVSSSRARCDSSSRAGSARSSIVSRSR